MSALASLAALVLTTAPAVDPPPSTAVTRALPATVEVGEPFRWVVEVRHPRGRLRELSAQLETFAAGLDPSWALLEPEPVLAVPDSEREGWMRTTAGWSAVSLEPGERELPAPELVVGDERVAAATAALEVAGVLSEDEDEPRPARGLRPAPARGEGNVLLPALLVGGALALAALGALVARRRRGARAGERGPSAVEELARLARSAAESPPQGAAARDLAYELSAALRGVLDERAGADRRGLTDEEWADAVAASDRPAGAPAEALREHLARWTAIEHGAHAPSPWALRELAEEALELAGSAGAAREDAR